MTRSADARFRECAQSILDLVHALRWIAVILIVAVIMPDGQIIDQPKLQGKEPSIRRWILRSVFEKNCEGERVEHGTLITIIIPLNTFEIMRSDEGNEFELTHHLTESASTTLESQ